MDLTESDDYDDNLARNHGPQNHGPQNHGRKVVIDDQMTSSLPSSAGNLATEARSSILGSVESCTREASRSDTSVLSEPSDVQQERSSSPRSPWIQRSSEERPSMETNEGQAESGSRPDSGSGQGCTGHHVATPASELICRRVGSHV